MFFYTLIGFLVVIRGKHEVFLTNHDNHLHTQKRPRSHVIHPLILILLIYHLKKLICPILSLSFPYFIPIFSILPTYQLNQIHQYHDLFHPIHPLPRFQPLAPCAKLTVQSLHLFQPCMYHRILVQ